MNPLQIIAVARDAIILIALAFIVWWIYHAGGNGVRVDDMKAVQKQLVLNSEQEAEWRVESAAAELKHEQELSSLEAAINQQHRPVFIMRNPADPNPVSGNPSAPNSGQTNTHSAAVDTGVGEHIDIRPAINGWEIKLAKALADCHQDVQSWPTPPSH